MKIRVKYHDDGIKISQAHQGEWIDLMSAEDVEMKAGEFRLISLGVSIELPDGFEALVVPRSSTFKRYHILQANSVGVIDNAYWVFQGSTDTTFYILAVYFGSVGIKNTRHAVNCGLLADLAGIISAIFICYLFFS